MGSDEPLHKIQRVWRRAILLQGGPSADVFVCPSSSDRRLEAPAAQQAAALLSGRHCSYVYVGAGMTSAAGSDDVVAFDLPANHDKNGGNVLYGDASIQWEHFETLVQLVPELEAGRNPPVTRALTPAQAKQLYDQKWVPKLANLKDGTWAASLPQPATRPSAASPQPNGFERLSPAEEQQRDTSGR